MSRAGYTEEVDDNWQMIMWAGAVRSAIRGKRGQAFLRDLLTALDSLPEKRLIAGNLEIDGEVCALGAVGRMRGIDMAAIDAEDYCQVAGTFNISEALAREIEFQNDDDFGWGEITPEKRWESMRKWVVSQLATSTTDVG